MIIANPIYDVVFKRLMEDDRIARYFIGTLLNETVEDVKVKPQEYTYVDKLAGLAVFRLDFIATIKTETGEFKKVLIEIQKAKNLIDLMRFRRYLAEQYKKEEEIETNTGRKRVALPIVTIYLLGFSLPEITTSAIRVGRQYIDLITNEIISKKSDFIEKLTHDCFVVQLPRIQNKYKTHLDKLLSVFEQAHFTDENKITKEYGYEIDEEGIKTMTEILHYIGTNPAERLEIENEQEAYRVLDQAVLEKTEELKEELRKTQKAIADKNKLIDDKDKLIEDKDKLIQELMRKIAEK